VRTEIKSKTGSFEWDSKLSPTCFLAPKNAAALFRVFRGKKLCHRQARKEREAKIKIRFKRCSTGLFGVEKIQTQNKIKSKTGPFERDLEVSPTCFLAPQKRSRSVSCFPCLSW